MGVVVTIALLLGMISFAFDGKLSPLLKSAFSWFLLVMGLWNALWYGLQNLEQFWGFVALCSGAVMVLSATLMMPSASEYLSTRRYIGSCCLVFLLGFFLLYSITLVQLNLGYPILK